MPVGVFRAVERPTYDDLMTSRSSRPSPQGEGDLREIFLEGDTWTVEAVAHRR